MTTGRAGGDGGGADDLKAALVRIARRMYERRLVVGRQGNVSVRDADGSVWLTPAGMCKGDVSAEDLVCLDLDGNVLAGWRLPTSERTTHLEAYRQRPDVGAVVHGHPTFCTAFAAAQVALPSGVLPEAVITLGEVPLVPYGTPSSVGLTDTIRPYLAQHDCFLLANHGALAMGATLDEAFDRLEQLEFCASVLWHAKALGGAKALTSEQLGGLGSMASTERDGEGDDHTSSTGTPVLPDR